MERDRQARTEESRERDNEKKRNMERDIHRDREREREKWKEGEKESEREKYIERGGEREREREYPVGGWLRFLGPEPQDPWGAGRLRLALTLRAPTFSRGSPRQSTPYPGTTIRWPLCND